MKINLKEFESREKLIRVQKHDTLPLLIWNYTEVCQFSKAWDKYTLMARGLITDIEGNIIARPFKKFFNWGEDSLSIIPSEMPIISEKMDGSLGILYFDGIIPKIATRGSFNSDQAQWATKWIQENHPTARLKFNPDYTYLFEIIYPENRIVVDYKDRKELILLAVINTESGDENYLSVEKEAERLKIAHAPRHKVLNINEVLEKTKSLTGNEEGFVFHWPKTGERLKIKGKEYVRLHKLLTEFSTISIWELLKENQSFDELLERVPDEFYNWVRETQNKLTDEFSAVFEASKKAWIDVAVLPSRKEQAVAIIEKYPDIASYVFSMLDEKDPSKIIWRNLRPKYEKPFTNDIDL